MRDGVWRWVWGQGLEVLMYVEGGSGVCMFWSSGSVRAICVRVWLYGGLVGRGEGGGAWCFLIYGFCGLIFDCGCGNVCV